jgi:hypothetical protein
VIGNGGIPARLTGGWIRHGISIDGGPVVEDALVWWLQAPSRHCDLRVPFSGTDGLMSFAGTTKWADPSLTWVPEIELNPSIFTDTGVITWDGADLMETGHYYEGTRKIPYVERWVRLRDGEGELLALSYEGSSARGRLVRTGNHALTIVDARPGGGQFAATAWRLTDGAWGVHHCWPSDAVTPRPPLTVVRSAHAVQLDDGLEWTVDEYQAGTTSN